MSRKRSAWTTSEIVDAAEAEASEQRARETKKSPTEEIARLSDQLLLIRCCLAARASTPTYVGGVYLAEPYIITSPAGK